MSLITAPPVLDTTGQLIAEKLDSITEEIARGNDIAASNFTLQFDGTVRTYRRVMRHWFLMHNANLMTPEGLTDLCEKWYTYSRIGWAGTSIFPQVDVSDTSTGTKGDDNAGMICIPSTDSVANRDDYAGLPLFAITNCNWILDSEGNILITAIEGITDGYEDDNPDKFVGVMQQTGFVKVVEGSTERTFYYADSSTAYSDLVPLPEAVKLDGTVRSFVVHGKYMSTTIDGKMTCCKGNAPTAFVSHDTLVTLPDTLGTQYSGGTVTDWSFLIWMAYIKYASLTLDGILQGCVNYNYQYYANVGETNVNRVILSTSEGANLVVGSTVLLGAYAGNADRGQAAVRSLSNVQGRVITSIENVTISGTTYSAVYFDGEPITTVANGNATNGSTILSTWYYKNGYCDTVMGNDGSPGNAGNGKHSAKLQGIEYSVGGYEVLADVILNIADGYYTSFIAKRSTHQATSVTANMITSSLKCAQPSSNQWNYIKKLAFDGEIFFATVVGGSTSTYTRDGFYMNGTGTATSTREWLAFGYLSYGVSYGGLSCLSGTGALSYGNWACLARLSPNGNRG